MHKDPSHEEASLRFEGRRHWSTARLSFWVSARSPRRASARRTHAASSVHDRVICEDNTWKKYYAQVLGKARPIRQHVDSELLQDLLWEQQQEAPDLLLRATHLVPMGAVPQLVQWTLPLIPGRGIHSGPRTTKSGQAHQGCKSPSRCHWLPSLPLKNELQSKSQTRVTQKGKK